MVSKVLLLVVSVSDFALVVRRHDTNTIVVLAAANHDGFLALVVLSLAATAVLAAPKNAVCVLLSRLFLFPRFRFAFSHDVSAICNLLSVFVQRACVACGVCCFRFERVPLVFLG